MLSTSSTNSFLNGALLSDISELSDDDLELLTEGFEIRGEESANVVLSQLLAQIKAQLALSLIDVALSVLLDDDLVLSELGDGLHEIVLAQSRLNGASEGLEIHRASDNWVSSRSRGGLALLR